MLEPSLDKEPLNGPGRYIFGLAQSSYPIFSMVWDCIDDIRHTHVTEHVLSMNENDNDSSDHCSELDLLQNHINIGSAYLFPFQAIFNIAPHHIVYVVWFICFVCRLTR